jgi:DNA invertase Pin-like site-specific DNA recombinase
MKINKKDWFGGCTSDIHRLHLRCLQTEQIKLERKKMTSQERKFVAYFRQFGTSKVANSLGTQKAKVAKFLEENKGKLIADYIENESKFAKTRPALAAAIAVCKKNKAKLLIATLDKLNRDMAFSQVLLDDKNVDFMCVEVPVATREMLKMRMVFAEWEAKKIGERTKTALAKLKKQGVKLGSPRPEVGSEIGNKVNSAKADSFAERVAPTVRQILKKSRASTLRDIAAAFAKDGLLTPRGNAEWSPTQVKNLLKRIK